MKILVQRAGALGDVLCVTPITHFLRSVFPEAEIHVETARTEIFEGNPHINSCRGLGTADNDYGHVVNLNLAYERQPDIHVVDAYYMEVLKVFPQFNKNISNLVPKRVVFGIDPPPPPELRAKSNNVVVHAARSWSNRTMPDMFWNVVINSLVAYGYNVTVIGHGMDYRGPVGAGIVNMVGNLALREAVNQVAGASCFVGSDSSLLHFVGATETPAVGIFTSVKAEYRIPYRHGILGFGIETVTPDVPCYGCLEVAPIPTTDLHCRFSTDDCVGDIAMNKAFDVVAKVTRLAKTLQVYEGTRAC